MVPNIIKVIKTSFILQWHDLVSKTILVFVPFFVKPNHSCKFNPAHVSMLLKKITAIKSALE